MATGSRRSGAQTAGGARARIARWRRRWRWRRTAVDDALSRSPLASAAFGFRGALSIFIEHPRVVHGHAGAEGSAAEDRHDYAAGVRRRPRVAAGSGE